MHILPNKSIQKKYNRGCIEKLESYCLLASLNLPVLKSVIVTSEELSTLSCADENLIKKYLGSNQCMIRYLYKMPNHIIKNGGANILISAKNLLNEREKDADFWLLEASNRLENICCCNICLNRQIGNLHIEILGKGFDISDINKGKLCPHEYVDIPYPIYYGTYGEWWRWAQFHFCSQEAYINSIVIREERVKKFDSQQEVEFEPSYRPVDLGFFEHLFYWIQLIEESALIENSVFYNLSCSYDYNKRFIFWDIQTPVGKLRAYC